MKKEKILIIGEVLFDKFSTGEKMLGGAPFNVAWNLKGFGLDPLFVSCVGDDEDGKVIIETMREWGMDTGGIQIDKKFPTGIVDITMNGNDHTFDILSDQAYDNINFEKIDIKDFNLLYNGSLALRTDEAYKNYISFKNKSNTLNFLDVNLRESWYDIQKIKEMIKNCDYLKLNNEELVEVFGDMDAKKVFEENNLKMLILTEGKNGATIFAGGEEFSSPIVQEESFVDSVGAGDAFASVVIYGILNDWEIDKNLQKALRFSADVCCINGAICSDNGFYNL